MKPSVCVAILGLVASIGAGRTDAQKPSADLGAPIAKDAQPTATQIQGKLPIYQPFPAPLPPAMPPPLATAPVLDLLEAPSEMLRVRAEPLLWWTRGQSLPPLLTTSPTGTARPSAGILGQPGTTVLGDEVTGDLARSGARFALLVWFDPEQSFGFEANFLFLAAQTAQFGGASNGEPILGRPIFNALTGKPDAVLTAFPGIVFGGLNVVSSTSSFYGGEVNHRSNVIRSDWGRLDALVGYRYLGFNDSVSVSDTEISPGTLDRVDVFDRFQSSNQFHGAQIGAVAEWRRGPWYVEWIGKIALGGTCSSVDIDGNTSFNGAAPVPGGVLAVASNIGHYRSTRFAVLPELGVNLGYNVTPACRLFAGYTFIYLSDVARAGDQINLAINPNLFPPPVLTGPAQPAFIFHHTDFWAQGVNVGVEVRY